MPDRACSARNAPTRSGATRLVTNSTGRSVNAARPRRPRPSPARTLCHENARSTVARATRAERGEPARVGEQLLERARQHLGVPRGHEHHPVAGARDLRRTGLPERADRGHAAGHRLDVGDAERLVGRGQHEHVPVAHPGERLEVRQLAGELDVAGQPEVTGQRLQRAALGPVPDDEVAQRGHPLAQQPHRAQDVGVALARDEVPDADERRLAGGRAERGRQIGAQPDDARCARRPSRGSAARSRRCWRGPSARRRGPSGRRRRRPPSRGRCGRRPPRARTRRAARRSGRGGPPRRRGRRCARGRGRSGTCAAAAAVRCRSTAPRRRPRRRTSAAAAGRRTARTRPAARRAPCGGAGAAARARRSPRPAAPPAASASGGWAGAARGRGRPHRPPAPPAPGGAPTPRAPGRSPAGRTPTTTATLIAPAPTSRPRRA